MTAIRSPQDLNNLVDKELAWRKHEIATIHNQHSAARGHLQKILRRAGVAIFYAHWEGLVKVLSTAYIDLVSRSGCKYSELRPNFVALGAKAYLVQFAESSKAEILCSTADFFLGPSIEGKAKEISPDVIDTKSNLSFEVFRDISRIIGIDHAKYAVYQVQFFDGILKFRNRIAHGEYLEVDVAKFDYFHATVTKLFQMFSDDLLKAAWSAQYRMPEAAPSKV